MLIKQMCYGCASILIVTSLFLAGCGGGGGGSSALTTTIKGVAAKGAPLASAKITLTDSSVPAKTVTATTDANGNFSFDVSGLTAPFVLQAKLGTITLFSVQDKAPVIGQSIIVNITPITTAIAGVLSTTGKPAGITPAVVTTTKLTSVKIFIQKSLAPSLTTANVPTTFDPINDSFAADGTGFDSVLENVQVAQSSTNDIWLVDKNITRPCVAQQLGGCWTATDPGNTTTTASNICGSDIATGAPVPCDPSKPTNESLFDPNAVATGTPTFVCYGCVFMGNDDNFAARASSVTTATTLSVTATAITPAPATTTTPTTTTPTTTTPTTTTPTTTGVPSTASSSISTGSANGFSCATRTNPGGRCSYLTFCAANTGTSTAGYFQTNLGTYPVNILSSSSITNAGTAAAQACAAP